MKLFFPFTSQFDSQNFYLSERNFLSKVLAIFSEFVLFSEFQRLKLDRKHSEIVFTQSEEKRKKEDMARVLSNTTINGAVRLI